MDQRGEQQPHSRTRIFSLQHGYYNPDRRRSRKRPRVHILVHDVESSARDRYSQQRRDQSSAAISGSRAAKADSPKLPASPQQNKNARELPGQERPFKRQMCNPGRPGDQVRKQGELCMAREKFIVKRIQRWVEQLLDPWNVNFCIFNKRVVTLNRNRGPGEQKQNGKIFRTRKHAGGINARGILRISFGGWLQYRAHNSW